MGKIRRPKSRKPKSRRSNARRTNARRTKARRSKVRRSKSSGKRRTFRKNRRRTSKQRGGEHWEEYQNCWEYAGDDEKKGQCYLECGDAAGMLPGSWLVSKNKRKRHYRECDGINRGLDEGKPTEKNVDDQTLISNMNKEPAYQALMGRKDEQDVQDALLKMRTAWAPEGKGVQFDRSLTSNSKPPNSRSFRRVGPELSNNKTEFRNDSLNRHGPK